MATGFSVMDALNKNSKAGIEETPKARFRTKDISIFKMYRNEMNFYSISEVDELAGDILTFGLKQNLELVYEPCEKGEYRIVAGERRWLALKQLVSKGYKEFEMATSKLTTPQGADEEQVEIIIANAYRNKSVADMIEEEKRLKKSLERMKAEGKQIKGYDIKSGRLRNVIASMLHMSETKVAQIESVNNNLIPEFKEELKNERLTFSAAYELSGMSADKQQEALDKFKESGELSHKEIKGMKDDIKMGEDKEKPEGDVIGADMAAGADYQTPHPESITSLCYSCKKYIDCNVKTGTCQKCDQYISKAEIEKTDEQKYSDEQDKIDKETARRLREQEENQKMDTLPSEAAGQQENSNKCINISNSAFEEIINGKRYLILKNDNYKIGQKVTIAEYTGGKPTGVILEMLISHMDDENTSIAIESGYCVLNVLKEQAVIYKDGEIVAEQPELPTFKNNEQRKAWLEDVEAWGLWYEDRNIQAKYYKYDFPDGSRLIAVKYRYTCPPWLKDTEFKELDGSYKNTCYHMIYSDEYRKNHKYEYEEYFTNSTVSISTLAEFIKEIAKKTSR